VPRDNRASSVLVLDGHARAAVECVQALGRLGLMVDVASEDPACVSFRSRYARERFAQPPRCSSSSSWTFIEWLRRLDSLHHYDLIVPATEISLLGFLDLDDRDPIRDRAVLPPNEALDVTLDKQQTWKLATRLDIRVPGSRLIESADPLTAATGGYPMVLKPTRSQLLVDGKFLTARTGVVLDGQERHDFLLRWLPHGPVLQQEYVPGHGIGIELLYDRGRKLWHFAHERIHEMPLTGGASTYRKSIAPVPHLLAAAEKLLNELRWHGVAMVEFRVDSSSNFWLMEINPRLWGSLALSIDAGVNFPLGLLRLARGESPGAQPPYRSDYYTRDLPNDLRWLRLNLRAESRSSRLLARPRLTTFGELLRPLIGRESWDHFDWHDLRVSGSVLASVVRDVAESVGRGLRRRSFRRASRRHHARVLRQFDRAGHRPTRFLFLCHGNICRSPFAATLADAQLPGCEIRSAGFHPIAGRSAPAHVVAAARRVGEDLAEFRSRSVSQEDVSRADLILLMDSENHRDFARRFPDALPRTTLLGLFAPSPVAEIADPYAATAKETESALAHIAESVESLARWLRSGPKMDRQSVRHEHLRFLWLIELDYRSGMWHGANLRWFNLSREIIARGHQAYFLVNRERAEDLQAMRGYLDSLVLDRVISGYFETAYEYPAWRGRLASLLSWPPFANCLLRRYQRVIATALHELLTTQRFDVCVIGERRLLFLLSTLQKHARVIIDWGDSFVLYYSRQIRTHLRAGYVLDLVRDVRELLSAYLLERYYGRRSAANLVVSPVDKGCLDRVNGVQARNHVLLNGLRYPPQQSRTDKIPNRIVFTGNMNFPPNYEGAMWFIDHVMPLVCRSRPDVEFIVAGRNPAPELLRKASKGVRILGAVDDMHHEIAKSAVYVAPLISGGGFKNKILEAISSGTVVVATPIAVEFLNDGLRELLMVGGTPEEMASRIVSVLDNPGLHEARLERLRQRIYDEFTWEERADELARLARP
jgi:protein-tyrosine-phosphatase/glycosyltransferase involved in cell wall biosynthesis/predicted ATP-grasp superfamily ATP-dependent carboligase